MRALHLPSAARVRAWFVLSALTTLSFIAIATGDSGPKPKGPAHPPEGFKTSAIRPNVNQPFRDYVFTASSGASIVSGTDDAGIHCDDCIGTVSLPFSYTLYDQTFNTINVSSNGTLQFVSANGAYSNDCLPDGNFSYTIFPFWDDLYTVDAGNGQGIFTSTSGSAPNRIFNIEWRAQYCCTGGSPVNDFEVRLYEGQQRFDIIYGSPLNARGSATVGVENGDGTLFTQYVCNNTGPTSGLQLAFSIPQCTAPPSAMIAWWPGEGDANDIQGSHDATNNGVTFGAGEVGDAFSFDGSGVFLDVADAPDLHLDASVGFTFDFWINPSQFGVGSSGYDLLFSKAINPGSDASYFAFLDPSGHVGIGLQNSIQFPEWIATSALPLNTWSHVALVYRANNFDGSDMTIYVNGSAVPTSFAANGYDSSFSIGYSSNRLVIGGDADNLVGGSLSGLLDELEIFNRPLSSTEVQNIYNAGPAGKCRSCAGAPGSMVSWWKAEGDATDSQGSNDGTFNGTAAFGAGEVGQAFSIDANSSNYISVPHSANLDLTQFTLDLWVYPTTSGDVRYLIDKEPPNSNSSNYYLALEPDNSVEFGFMPGQYQNVDSTVSIPTNAWTHLAATYDGTTLNLYINGRLDVSKAADPNFLIPPMGQDLGFGYRNSLGSNVFTGLLDEIEIYARALTQREVQKIYDAGTGGKCPCTSAPEGMVSWWGLDGNTFDMQGNNDLSLFRGPSFVTGEIGQALNFTGGQAASPGSPSSLNITSNHVTIDGWVNLNATQAQGVFFGKTRSGQNDYALFMLASQLAGSIRTANGVEHFLYTGYVPPNGVWTHIAQVYDGTNQTIYVNGQPIASQPVSGNVRNDRVNFYIGGRENGNDLTINAAIDEVEVFNAALSPHQIGEIYEAGGAGKCRPYYNVAVNAGTGGSASGGGTFRQGTAVEVSATPNDCYQFAGWFENGQLVSSSNPYDFAVKAGGRNLVAMFSKIQYEIDANVSPSGGGSVDGAGEYDCGAPVSLTAHAASCYTFVNWTDENGQVVATSPQLSGFNASANRTFTANFSLNRYTISVSASPTVGGTVSGGGNYNCGSQATVTAHPNGAYLFFDWTENGTEVSTSASYSFTVGGNRTLVANFKKPSTQLSASGAISRPNNKQATFSYGYKAGQKLNATTFIYRDPGSNVSIASNAITSVTFNFNRVHVVGSYNLGRTRETFTADFTDNGPNGAGDQFSITISPLGYSASGNLISGDIYIH